MSSFKDITFEFGGETYTVKANNVFRLIAQIEEVITVTELFTLNAEKLPLARLADAYAVCLKYAGAKAEPEDVYCSMLANGAGDVINYVQGLVAVVIPPEELRGGGSNEKKTEAKA